MPVPKRRHARSRGRKRRTYWRLNPPQLTECPHCHELIRPHRVCPNCGYYKGKMVITVEEE
ncbi:MAG TPA: 50S ribosomal protein L32 [bacterium (Candidatus Stahlbacteria)]|nr:50S ribosomal protein L32 [Candidatus Stahlbacteria bacterium]